MFSREVVIGHRAPETHGHNLRRVVGLRVRVRIRVCVEAVIRVRSNKWGARHRFAPFDWLSLELHAK